VKRLILGALAVALIALAVQSADADCQRQRVYTPTATYVAPVHHAPTYHYAAPQVLEVEVHRDRYYSLSDLYRDRLYLDLYERLVALDERKAQAAQSSDVLQQKAPPKAPTAKITANTDPEVEGPQDGSISVLIASRCVRCHKAGSDVDLSKPDAVPRLTRLACWEQVHHGEMPQGGKPLSDKAEKTFLAWYKSAK
jgi:hypothetical protein